MNEEEKKAFNYLKKYIEWETAGERNLEGDIKTILTLIEKKERVIEELKKNNGYHLGFIDGGISKRYEMEDKLKVKIEEITSYAYTSEEERECQDYAIQVLKELLGE